MTLRLQLTHHDKMRILVGDVEVGGINLSEKITDLVEELLNTDKEKELVKSAEKPEENMHLGEITILDRYRGNRYFTEAVIQFELYYAEAHYKGITLFTEKSMKEVYTKLGYVELGYLASVNSYLMEKRLV